MPKFHSIQTFTLSFFIFLKPATSAKILPDKITPRTEESISAESSYEPKYCSFKLLKNYISEPIDNEDARTESSHRSSRSSYRPYHENHRLRESMPPSDFILSNCTNIEDSCCLDSEFEQFREGVDQSIRKLSGWQKIFGEVIPKVANLDETQISELAKRVPEIFWSDNDLSLEKFQNLIKYLSENKNYILKNAASTFDLSKKYSTGLACALCESKNHTNFQITPNEEDNLSLNYSKILDVEICHNAFHSENILDMFEFIKDYSVLAKIGKIFIAAYGLKWRDFGDDLHLMSKLIASNLKKRFSQCEELSGKELKADIDCLDLCMSVIPFNQSFISKWIQEVLVLNELLKDFLSGKSGLLKIYQETFYSAKSSLDQGSKSFSDGEKLYVVKFLY